MLLTIDALFSNPWLLFTFFVTLSLSVSLLNFFLHHKSFRSQDIHLLFMWCLMGLLPLIIFVSSIYFALFGISGFIAILLSPIFLTQSFNRLHQVVVVTWFVTITVILSLITKIVLQELPYFKKHLYRLTTKQLLTTSVTSVIVLVLSFTSILKIMDYCNQSKTYFHIFNAHLKDVCSNEKWQQQCPRTKADLRNFDPPHFDQMSMCTQTDYYFDEDGKGTLLMRFGNFVLISDDRFEDRFDLYYLRNYSSRKTYPPSIDGEWGRIKIN